MCGWRRPRALEDGKGQRLLISGVNREATRADVQTVTKAGQEPIYDCCVDLGFTAADTIGNARETAEWAHGKGYTEPDRRHRRLPHAAPMLELRAAMPNVELFAYPVKTDLNAHRWWRTSISARRMIVEYCKYLAILGREAFLGLGPKDKPAPAAKEAS
jgi:uncharacterized SAM-binding protein YcdF (DUF218 family)